MLVGIAVQPGGVGIEQQSHIGGQRGPVALDSGADIEQVRREIDLGPVGPDHRPGARAGHRHHLLQRREIIFGMGKGDAVGDVGIAIAKNVRHPPFVAHDFDCARLERGWLARRGAERFPQRQSARDSKQ